MKDSVILTPGKARLVVSIDSQGKYFMQTNFSGQKVWAEEGLYGKNTKTIFAVSQKISDKKDIHKLLAKAQEMATKKKITKEIFPELFIFTPSV